MNASHLKTIKVIPLTTVNNKEFNNVAYLRRELNRSYQIVTRNTKWCDTIIFKNYITSNIKFPVPGICLESIIKDMNLYLVR